MRDGDSGDGGAASLDADATFERTVIVDNSAGRGGAIRSGRDTTLTNTTLTGNTADLGGGVFDLGGVLVYEHSTSVGNTSAGFGGELYSNGTSGVSLTASVLFGDCAATPRTGSPAGVPPDGGYNLVSTSCAIYSIPNTTDLVGVDPQLAPFDESFPALVPLPDSPVIDAVPGISVRRRRGRTPPPAPTGRGM